MADRWFGYLKLPANHVLRLRVRHDDLSRSRAARRNDLPPLQSLDKRRPASPVLLCRAFPLPATQHDLAHPGNVAVHARGYGMEGTQAHWFLTRDDCPKIEDCEIWVPVRGLR